MKPNKYYVQNNTFKLVCIGYGAEDAVITAIDYMHRKYQPDEISRFGFLDWDFFTVGYTGFRDLFEGTEIPPAYPGEFDSLVMWADQIIDTDTALSKWKHIRDPFCEGDWND